MILALAGGVGGAKLAGGLQRALGRDLTVVVNTGDDFHHMGLVISPDLDTVMYTLAGINNRETGWGIAGETWAFMEMTAKLGGETWFRLGDRDLATHVERTRRLTEGDSLSVITADLCARLGVQASVVPMSDMPVPTWVETDAGDLAFQDYFVRHRCEPVLRALHFQGVETAVMSSGFEHALDEASAIVLCPSNPYLSIAPILALEDAEQCLRDRRAPVVAVSPIVGGAAIKGPAAKIMRELGHEPSALEVARHYRGLLTGFVLDRADAALAPQVGALGMKALVTDTIMRDPEASATLAQRVLAFVEELR